MQLNQMHMYSLSVSPYTWPGIGYWGDILSSATYHLLLPLFYLADLNHAHDPKNKGNSVAERLYNGQENAEVGRRFIELLKERNAHPAVKAAGHKDTEDEPQDAQKSLARPVPRYRILVRWPLANRCVSFIEGKSCCWCKDEQIYK